MSNAGEGAEKPDHSDGASGKVYRYNHSRKWLGDFLEN